MPRRRDPQRRKKSKESTEVPYERLRCACGKWGYKSEPIATIVLDHVQQQPDHLHSRHGTPIRVYQCPKSGWWHLTSKPL